MRTELCVKNEKRRKNSSRSRSETHKQKRKKNKSKTETTQIEEKLNNECIEYGEIYIHYVCVYV